MAKLTKRDLVVRISNETGLAQNQVFEVVQKTFDYITDSLAEGESVELRNFGVFEIRLTKRRIGRNPKQPGSRYEIPERTIVKFRMGKAMGQKVSRMTAILRYGANGKQDSKASSKTPAKTSSRTKRA